MTCFFKKSRAFITLKPRDGVYFPVENWGQQVDTDFDTEFFPGYKKPTK